jgi:putative iron-dependent peroxidase
MRSPSSTPDGNEYDILRDNMPFGRPGQQEFGTYFIGYSRYLWVIEKMLQRMFIGDPPGAYDRLLDFSTPHTGTTFFTHPRHAANAGPGVTKSRCIDECTPWA